MGYAVHVVYFILEVDVWSARVFRAIDLQQRIHITTWVIKYLARC